MTFRPLIFIALLSFAVASAPAALRGSKVDKFPRGDEPARPNPPAPETPKRRYIFGIGIGFERTSTLTGMALNIVLPDGPAFRMGLTAGSVVAEINGEATTGRTGEECARMIREGGNTVKLKVFDATLRERVIQLDKEWIAVPE